LTRIREQIKERKKIMCSTPDMKSDDEFEEKPEIIKTAVQADAASQKANAQNRTGAKGFISDNIRTANTGIEDEIVSSKKKLLGE